MCGNDYLGDYEFVWNCQLIPAISYVHDGFSFRPEVLVAQELSQKFSGKNIAVYDFGYSTGTETVQFQVALAREYNLQGDKRN